MLSIFGSNASDFALLGTCAPLTVGSTCYVNVSFAPGMGGPRTGSFNVAQALITTQSIPLTGTGVGTAAFTVTPGTAPYTFPTTPVISSSYATFTVTNTGTSGLVVGGDFLNGMPSGSFANNFSFVPNSCRVISPGGTCTVQFLFAPVAAGSYSGTMEIYGTAPSASVQIPFTATATPAAPMLVASPTYDFGSHQVLTTATGQVSFRNAGNAIANNVTLQLSGTNASDFALKGNCAPIAVGATCYVNITFIPGASGARTATLTVNAAQAAGPTVITLTGTGTP